MPPLFLYVRLLDALIVLSDAGRADACAACDKGCLRRHTQRARRTYISSSLTIRAWLINVIKPIIEYVPLIANTSSSGCGDECPVGYNFETAQKETRDRANIFNKTRVGFGESLSREVQLSGAMGKNQRPQLSPSSGVLFE